MNTLVKYTFAATMLLFAVSSIRAQPHERYKYEGFGGYSYLNLNRGIDPDEINDNFSDFPANRVNAHGFNGSFTYNWSRYLGAKFDVTLHTHGEDFTSLLTVNPLQPTATVNGTFKTSQNVYQYMGGVQIKDNSKVGPKFKPWAHILAGVSDQHFSVDETAPVNSRLINVNSTDFAMKFGGGLDYKIHRNFDVRLIQFDWNPIFRGNLDLGPNFRTQGSTLQNNWLLTFGVVIH
jgi:opacity protein-like surface antigen